MTEQITTNRYFISASAGTGKTTRLLQDVMLDLLVRAESDENASIRQSLIITFTVAAAEELRTRLDRNCRYAVRYAQDPQLVDSGFILGGDDGDLAKRIRQNSPLATEVFSKAVDDLPTAQISSIDALNKHIVDRNADVLGLDPGYQILADEAIRKGMQRQVLDELFEQWYDPEHGEHAAFMDLLENVGGAQSDDKLKSEIMGLYDQAQSKPGGLKWLDSLSEPYRITFQGVSPVRGISEYADKYFDEWKDKGLKLRDEILKYLSGLENGRKNARKPEDLLKDSKKFSSCISELNELEKKYETGSWDEMYTQLLGMPQFVASLKDGKSKWDQRCISAVDDLFPDVTKGTEDNKQGIKLLKTFENHVNELQNLFCAPAEQMDRIDAVAERRIDALVHAVNLFEQNYGAEKKRLSVAEFSDVSHQALKALRDPQVLRRINAKWPYIYVDECQDNNAMQNEFIDIIGRDAKKVTMVGDVKQSIYGFRYAQPEEFQANSRQITEESHRRSLTVNYRSKPEILLFVNTVFDRLMRESMGGVDYVKERFRIASRPKDYDGEAVELLLRDQQKYEEEQEKVSESANNALVPREAAGEQQVDMIVRRIQRLCENEETGGEGFQYGDIAVLARSSAWFADLYDRLTARGIPVEVKGVGDFYSKPEIMIALDWLNIIDNAHLDVPLVAVLRANGFDSNDLAALRLLGKGSLYGILYRIANPSEEFPFERQVPDRLAQKRESIADFLKALNDFRFFASAHPLDELLWHIYTVTGWYDYCGALPDGAQRKTNLAQLCGKARTFEAAGEHGIRAFLNAVEQWIELGDRQTSEEASTLPTKNAVHVMTIHQSKGREWPVVIIMGACMESVNELKRPNFPVVSASDGQDRGLAACSLIDARNQVRIATFQRKVLGQQAHRHEISEQLRLLYVAMTRPQKKLIIAGICGHEFENDWPRLSRLCSGAEQSEDKLDETYISSSGRKNYAGSYMNWIVSSLWSACGIRGTIGDTEKLYNLLPGSAEREVEPGLLDSERVQWIPDGLVPDTDEGNADDRKFAFVADMLPLEKQTMMDGSISGFEMTTQRPSVSGFARIDDRLLPRIPAAVSASGAGRWLSNDADDVDENSDDAANDDDEIVVDNKETQYAEWQYAGYALPSFMYSKSNSQPSPALIGTAVHNVLELFDWSCGADSQACRQGLLDVIERLEGRGVMLSAVADEVRSPRRLDGMMWFVLGAKEGGCKRLVDGIRAHRDRLYREAPFAMLLDVGRLKDVADDPTAFQTESAGDGKIVVRGIIDGYYVDDAAKQIVLFDYKTDVVRSEERDDLDCWARRLHDDYFGQQSLYAEALEQMYDGYVVAQRWLVGLDGHRLIDVSK